jgi:hypothetical protein
MICFGVLASCCAAEGVTLKTLYSFCSEKDCADGHLPLSGLLRDHDGNIVGFELQKCRGQRPSWIERSFWS